MKLERRLEELRAKLAAHDEVKLLVGIKSPDPDVEPLWIALGGSDEAKSEVIAEASRRWRAEHAEKSDGS